MQSSVINAIGKNGFNARLTEAICEKLSIVDSECITINRICCQCLNMANTEKFGVIALVYNLTCTIIVVVNRFTREFKVEICSFK